MFETHALVLDTGTVKLVGRGEANLVRRNLDLVVRAYSQDLSLIKEQPPLHVAGSLSNPSISVGAGDASSPSALVDEPAEDVPCRDLLETARSAAPRSSSPSPRR